LLGASKSRRLFGRSCAVNIGKSITEKPSAKPSNHEEEEGEKETFPGPSTDCWLIIGRRELPLNACPQIISVYARRSVRSAEFFPDVLFDGLHAVSVWRR
jgi:hypothetical protein